MKIVAPSIALAFGTAFTSKAGVYILPKIPPENFPLFVVILNNATISFSLFILMVLKLSGLGGGGERRNISGVYIFFGGGD